MLLDCVPILIRFGPNSLFYVYRKIVLVHGKSEMVEICNKSIEHTFKGSPGARCKWLHYRTLQDKPCCYHDRSGGLGINVCPDNLDRLACRSEENPALPTVLQSDNCTISIKDPRVLDLGLYEGFMPHHTSKVANFSVVIHYHDICDLAPIPDNTHHLSSYWLLFLFIFAAVVLSTVLLVYSKCFPSQ